MPDKTDRSLPYDEEKAAVKRAKAIAKSQAMSATAEQKYTDQVQRQQGQDDQKS